MLKQFNFQGVAPAGTRAPSFPAGPHLSVVMKVEDAEAKDGVVGGFWVTFGAHPQAQSRAPGVTGAEQFRRWFAYEGPALGFTMKLFMTARQWTQEQLQAQVVSFDPCSPTNGLTNCVVPILSKPNSRADKVDPNKRYDDADVLDMEEYQKALLAHSQEAGLASAAAAVTLPNAGVSNLPNIPTTQQNVGVPATQTQALAGALPGMPSIPGAPVNAAPANALPPGLAGALPQFPTA